MEKTVSREQQQRQQHQSSNSKDEKIISKQKRFATFIISVLF